LTLSAVAAGESIWSDIEEQWERILHSREPKAQYIHMRETLGLRAPFSRKEGWTKEKVAALVFGLLQYLQTFHKKKLCLFACTVDMEAYRKLKAETYVMDSPVEICIKYCAQVVLYWYTIEYPELDLTAHYYFDQGEAFKEAFKKKWQAEHESVAKAYDKPYTIWSTIKTIEEAEAKKTPGLQVADVLAWATNRQETKPGQEFHHLCYVMKQVIASKSVIWDEAKLRKEYEPLIYRPFHQYE
jgi:hypothetical protein